MFNKLSAKTFLALTSIVALVSIFITTPANADLGDLGPDIVGIATSENFTCMNAKTGEVYCWGQSTNSNLGTGMESDNAVPHKVYGIKDSVKVDTGDAFACSLSNSGFVSCWGKNDVGQVGDGIKDTSDRIFPSYAAVIRNVKDITLGDRNACALNDSGVVYCWGDNKFGQLGNLSLPTSHLEQTIPYSILPIQVDIPEVVTSITSGSNHTCALTKSAFVYCWGSNLTGQLGLGLQNISISKPKAVPSLSGVTLVKSHYDSTCARTETAGLYCWGKGVNGELGESEWANRYLPRLMSGTYIITNTSTNVANAYPYATSLSKFAFGTNGGCGIDNKSGYGYIVCWGKNTGYEPTSVQALDVALGRNHGCMITITYTVACWGSNLYGQTGANIKSATWQSYAVLKGIPEWRNYITSWGISYTNNVGTLTWTGAAESKFVLYVEPFGLVCEAASILNCQVGTLESNTTYKVLLMARGSTTAYSRSAAFTFTTGVITTAIQDYQAKIDAAAKAASEVLAAEKAARKAEIEAAALAKKESLAAICETRKDELSDEVTNRVETLIENHDQSVSLLSNLTQKYLKSLSVKALPIITLAKNVINKDFGMLSKLETFPQDYVCTGDVHVDSTNILAIETDINNQIRALHSEITKQLNLWKSALLIRK